MGAHFLSGVNAPERSSSINPIGLAQVAGESHPILKCALADSRSAASTKVEWLVPHDNGHASWFNWTQIFRHPFGVSNALQSSRSYGPGSFLEKVKRETLGKHLAAIEQELDHGRLFRRIDYHFDEETGEWYPVETRGMGGVRFYLRRDLAPGDKLSLRILRDCVLLDRTAPDMDGYSGEYISEISLAVVPSR